MIDLLGISDADPGVPHPKRAVGALHVQNVSAYHARLKTRVRRFHGVATYYLENCVGWFRALDRMPPGAARPVQLLRS